MPGLSPVFMAISPPGQFSTSCVHSGSVCGSGRRAPQSCPWAPVLGLQEVCYLGSGSAGSRIWTVSRSAFVFTTLYLPFMALFKVTLRGPGVSLLCSHTALTLAPEGLESSLPCRPQAQGFTAGGVSNPLLITPGGFPDVSLTLPPSSRCCHGTLCVRTRRVCLSRP